ncbi:ArsR/SmtB family transcription factor [Niameybacter massiliensis]|uniref:ArsR/SmtB family transcription factor n=1 Tax=Niameybacter massiliensis TaxID=1658108 RepID=UPI0006B5D8F0|nr:winged helix-turn-helix domain-containing protein [Niameybacter massiliensis]
MNYTLHETLSPILEAYFALNMVANGSNPKEKEAPLLKNNPELKAEFDSMIALPCKLYDLVKEHCPCTKERLLFFFKHWEDPGQCIANLFLYPSLDTSFEALQIHLKTLSDDERFEFLKQIVLLSTSLENLKTDFNAFTLKTERELFQFIEQLRQLSDLEKYHITLVYYQYDTLLTELYQVLQETAQLIAPLLEEAKPLVNTFVTALDATLKQQGIDYFKNALNIALPPDSNMIIYPSLSAYNSLTLENFLGAGAYDHLVFGIHISRLIEIRNAYVKQEMDLTPFLKAIADSSKLDILRYLKEERLYASQLAERLGISNATVSHHVSTLLSLELISCEKEQNKVYFILNQTKIHDYIDILKYLFE